jgi:hypothetical protein
MAYELVPINITDGHGAIVAQSDLTRVVQEDGQGGRHDVATMYTFKGEARIMEFYRDASGELQGTVACIGTEAEVLAYIERRFA